MIAEMMWTILLCTLIIGLYMDGIALGLLSSLYLGLLTFSRGIMPTTPPYDLVILHAAWLIATATLEATGFFNALNCFLHRLITQSNARYALPVALCCYSISLLTGQPASLTCYSQSINNPPNSTSLLLLFPASLATYMATLISPLSITGLYLFVVIRLSHVSIFRIFIIIGIISLAFIILSSLLSSLMPAFWLRQLYKWHNAICQNELPLQQPTQPTRTYGWLGLMLLVAESILFCSMPTTDGTTQFLSMDKIFAIKLPMFIALIMLTIGAIPLLAWRIKSTLILQTDRFKSGIQQLVNTLGFIWLAETIIQHDRCYIVSMLQNNFIGHEKFYIIAMVYTLLIDPSMYIWLLLPILLGAGCSMWKLSMLLLVVHGAASIRKWLRYCLRAIKRQIKK